MIAILLQAALWIWFFGCIVTYRIGKRILVEGMGAKSAEFVMLCLYSMGVIACHLFRPAGKWMLFGVLVLWFVVQYFCHWHYTIFGASEKKLQGYNHCFRDTLRLFPISEKRIIPDLYHIFLHILILANIVICLV